MQFANTLQQETKIQGHVKCRRHAWYNMPPKLKKSLIIHFPFPSEMQVGVGNILMRRIKFLINICWNEKVAHINATCQTGTDQFITKPAKRHSNYILSLSDMSSFFYVTHQEDFIAYVFKCAHGKV